MARPLYGDNPMKSALLCTVQTASSLFVEALATYGRRISSLSSVQHAQAGRTRYRGMSPARYQEDSMHSVFTASGTQLAALRSADTSSCRPRS